MAWPKALQQDWRTASGTTTLHAVGHVVGCYTLYQHSCCKSIRSPLLLARCNLVGPEPVLRNVEGAGVIVRMIWPALVGVHDPIWPQKCELVHSSGCVPLCVTVLDGPARPTCRPVKDSLMRGMQWCKYFGSSTPGICCLW